MYYDLHIHSSLSPCSDDDMTVNNIVNMAYIKGLDLIAITDHNSMKQLQYLDTIAKNKVDFWYGVELQTIEEIHVLAYFVPPYDYTDVQEWINAHIIYQPNDPVYFGHQYILDKCDQVVGEEECLLITSLDTDIYETVEQIHHFHGIAILAHAMSKKYSIMNVFRRIPEDLKVEGIEVINVDEKIELIQRFPYLKNKVFVINSDSHRLDAIHEREYCLSIQELNLLKSGD